MGSKHQKRISAPRTWKIERKTHYWAVKPRPGPHPKDRSLPLLMIVRDVLKLADNRREAKKIIKEGKILVDQRVRRDEKFPVGLFDSVSIPNMDKHYRMLIDKHGRLTLYEISGEAAETKLCRVNNKTTLRGGVVQLNMHDGRNLLQPESLTVKTKDSLLLSLKDNRILDHFAYDKGSKVFIVGGKHVGEVGEIEEIITVRSSEPNMVRVRKLGDGETFETIEAYVFVVGEDKVELPEVLKAAG
ncbi:MAG: Ribosomal protein S4E [Candidatus Alkanophagales archaeon MCA70_species_1]|nr:Ribosomal protein S4E [Candidatus Alkanophaga volatiphilum]